MGVSSLNTPRLWHHKTVNTSFKYIITAGHCLTDVEPKDLKVLAGSILRYPQWANSNQQKDIKPQETRGDLILIHP